MSGPRLSRRGLLIAAGATGVTLALGLSGCTPRQTVVAPAGTAPLPTPPLAPSEVRDGVRHLALSPQPGTSRLIAGHPEIVTPTLGYNGAQLGPTVRARRGERLRVEIHNQLDEVTTLHWHGMHLPAEMDGGPHTPIEPGASRVAEWRIRQPASTLWYHPHPHGRTEGQVLAGLAGLVILDDDAADGSGLPDEYGVDDIPLILQDRFLDADGRSLAVDGDGPLGTIGRTLLANGLSGAHVDVGAELVRLRVLNGCSARFLDLRFGDGRAFVLVGTDGGLLPEGVELDHLVLSPAERAEILVRFAPGERVMLGTASPSFPGVPAGLADMPPGDFVEFRAARSLRPARSWTLPPEGRAPLDAAEAAQTRAFVLSMPFLNGREMDMTRIDAVVRVDTTEVWEVWTTDPFPHNFHVHDVQFRVLDIDGAPPPPQLAGWKDTVPVLPGQRTRIIMRFEHYTDPRIPYMMHCHLLRHEDAGMMGQFLVTADGTGPSTLDPLPGGAAHQH